MRIRHRRIITLVVVGFVSAVVLALAGLGLYTHTKWGRGKILGLTLRTLGGRLNGTLTVQRLEGNLLTGAKLYVVRLEQEDGKTLLYADSAFIEYDLPSFFGGDMVIHRLALFQPELLVQRLPGDSLWNYQKVLLDTTSTPSAGRAKATLVDELRLVNARIAVRIPWAPDSSLSERAQRRQVAAALRDTSREMVERVPGGFLQTMRFAVDEGGIHDLTVAPDERGGIYLGVDSLRGTAQVYRGPPLRIREAVGQLSMRNGLVRYQAPVVRLPNSRLSSKGSVDITSGGPKYDMSFVVPEVDLRDMQWLYPAMPDTGHAAFHFWLETRPAGTYYKVRELRLSTTGTRMKGRFGVEVGDTLLFTDVSLEADPLDMSTVEQMLPTEIPVKGLHIGAATVETTAPTDGGRGTS